MVSFGNDHSPPHSSFFTVYFIRKNPDIAFPYLEMVSARTAPGQHQALSVPAGKFPSPSFLLPIGQPDREGIFLTKLIDARRSSSLWEAPFPNLGPLTFLVGTGLVVPHLPWFRHQRCWMQPLRAAAIRMELWFECDRGLYSRLCLYICLQLEVLFR